MTPRRCHVGNGATPVVIVDGVSADALPEVVAAAAALAPFPAASGNRYPGLRRIVTPADIAANAYVDRMLNALAPFIGGGFDADAFDLVEASFSMVTSAPATLAPEQRMPHFDSVDGDYLAVLHYLSDTLGSGTAFYRQRSTGIEVVTADNVSRFVNAARAESAGLTGYLSGANPFYEQIGLVEGVRDRVAIYPGRLLHSGVIPEGMALDADPRTGRLTANLFIRTR